MCAADQKQFSRRLAAALVLPPVTILAVAALAMCVSSVRVRHVAFTAGLAILASWAGTMGLVWTRLGWSKWERWVIALLPVWISTTQVLGTLVDALAGRRAQAALRLVVAVGIVAAVYPPFFLARAIARRRAGRTPPEANG